MSKGDNYDPFNTVVKESQSERFVLCGNCKYWNNKSIHIIQGDSGQCMAASDNDFHKIFYVGDDIQAFDPYLITVAGFGCNQGESK